MKWGAIDIPNGNPLKVGGNQIDKIMFGNEQVWINNYLPSAITNFVASSSGANTTVTVTFSNADGMPTPTYNLYQNGTLVVTGIISGATYTSSVNGENTYYVQAVNSVGGTNSNSDTAVVWTSPVSSPRIVTATATLTAGIHFPSGVQVSLCLIGGGGGGAQSGDAFWGNGGGRGGIDVTGGYTLDFNEQVICTVGAGGARQTGNGAGGAGGASSFGTYRVANGGAGGTVRSGSSAVYNGNGGTRTTCAGSATHGTQTSWEGAGGEAGFGNGGNGAIGAAIAGVGGVGAGGGGIARSTWGSGPGGRGEIRISW